MKQIPNPDEEDLGFYLYNSLKTQRKMEFLCFENLGRKKYIENKCLATEVLRKKLKKNF